MTNGIYISAMGLMAQQYKQDVLANNLANAQTPGFKRQFANVRARANAAIEDPTMAAYRNDPINGQLNGGVMPMPSSWDWSQGTLISSSSQTDLALNGEGFFQLKGKDGETYLTRNGHFIRTLGGQLVTETTGAKLLGADGQEIAVNPALPFSVEEDGTVTQEGTTLGKVGIVGMKDLEGLEPVGNSMLKVRSGYSTSQADAMTTVRQGYVEQSGVDPVIEMVTMLEGQRSFEANAKMLTMQDQMLSQLNSIGRVA